MISACRLCHGKSSLFFEAVRPFAASYYQCSSCDLVQMDEDFFADREEEKSLYQAHQNRERNPGYLEFLRKCLDPTLAHLSSGVSGLDFGCGPYPMLAELMREKSFPTDHYDPYFYPDKGSLKQEYRFVTATEVVEHFNYPASSWAELASRVGKAGILSVMTSILYPHVDFGGWHYRRDRTHVCFYSPITMEWIAKKLNFEILEAVGNVVIFRKK